MGPQCNTFKMLYLNCILYSSNCHSLILLISKKVMTSLGINIYVSVKLHPSLVHTIELDIACDKYKGNTVVWKVYLTRHCGRLHLGVFLLFGNACH